SFGRTRIRPAHLNNRAAHLVAARSSYRGRAREYAARGRRLLPLGRSRVRPLLGISKWLAHLDVLTRRHGDLPGAVQSVLALFLASTRCATRMDRVARSNLGGDLDQSARLGPGWSRVDHRRLIRHARLSRDVDLECAPHHA